MFDNPDLTIGTNWNYKNKYLGTHYSNVYKI